MSIFNLDYLFKPKRIALFYDSNYPTLGETILKNLIFGKFNGTVFLISEKEEALWGIQSYPDLFSVPRDIDLALFTTDPSSWLENLEQCKKKGIKAVALYYPDFKTITKDYEKLLKKIKVFSYHNKIRILGPNTLGFIVPKLNLNASLYEGTLPKGHIGFISDSATFASGILDWAVDKNVGFSFFVSVGEKVDIDIEDMIEYLGYDPGTQAIVIYLESLESGRKFMRAARGFAKTKPIIVLKGGFPIEEISACFTILDELVKEDKVYSSAFRRAGVLEVKEVLDLFNLAEILEKLPKPKGSRLAIVTNSGGFSHLALKTLKNLGGKPAELSPETKEKLKDLLGIEEDNLSNPIDLLSTAQPEKYKKVLQILLNAAEIDGILIIYSPQYTPSSEDIALSIVSAYKASKSKKPLLINFVGAEKIREAIKHFKEVGLPVFQTPEAAIKSFIYLYQYQRNLDLLFETPSIILEDFKPDKDKVLKIIDRALNNGRMILTFSETMEVLKAYEIPVPKFKIASSLEVLAEKAKELGYPLTIALETQFSLSELNPLVEQTFQGIFDEDSLIGEAKKIYERLKGFPYIKKEIVLQEYIFNSGKIPLLIGTKRNKVFGNVIVFGLGENLGKLGLDYSIGLPPLNQILAKRLLEETSIYELIYLLGYPIHLLEELLVKFSHLIIDFPEIEEIVLNPILYYRDKFYCVRGTIILGEKVFDLKKEGIYCPFHLSICPYPNYLVSEEILKDGTKVIIRPIKPEDEPLLMELFKNLSEKSVLLRFQQPNRPLSKSDLIRFCHIDYDQEMTLVVLIKENNNQKIIGAAHLMKTYEDKAELSIEIIDQYHGKGLGTLLVGKLLDFAKNYGYKKIWMEIKKENFPMIKLALKYGFEILTEEEGSLFVEKILQN
ncbi:MAG: bifunctional acetate--CoA ligase family protein/GNAT family N-acetyltransferase [Caldimicrobium sp.]